MKTHHHARALRIRFVVVFVSAFVIFFGLLNVRFLFANVRYWAAPGTIVVKDTLEDAILHLPLSKDKEIVKKPLPNHATLVIDSLGIKAPIVFDVPPDNKQIYKKLEDGVVHYSSTSKPGEAGVALILGHSSAYPWYKGRYGSVFALLSKLKPGDRFYVQYEDGRTFIYEMKQAIVFNPFSSDARLAKLEQEPNPSLVLVSCYPVGTNYRRIAVQAEQLQI